MAFDPDLFLAETSIGSFDPDQFLADTEDKSISGFGWNLWEDVKGTAKGIGGLVEGAMTAPLETAKGVVTGLPGAIVEEGKRLGVGELLTGHPVNALEKFGEAAYDKPLSTALSVVPAAGVAGKVLGAGGKVARGAGLAEEAAQAAKVAGSVGDDLLKIAPTKSPKPLSIQAAEDFATQRAENVIPFDRVVGNTVQKGSSAPMTPKSPLKLVPEDLESTLSSAKKTGTDALSEVRDYITEKYGKASSQPGWAEKTAKYMQEEARKLGAKDLGLQSNQIRQMGEGFKGIEKAEALIDYARDKGYFRPGLTDISRKEMIKANMEKSGQTVGAIRDIASQRGQAPVDQMLKAVQDELNAKYAIAAPGDVKKTLAIIQREMKKDPTFSGISKISTELNKELRNLRSMGRHVGPNTDAADILSRLNNDAIRGVLNPEESQLYNSALRDFGAHKKLEKAVAGSERRELGARSNQRGILGRLWQEALDRGGYRIAGNVADRLSRSILKDPNKVKTIPQFFEELAHQADDVLDETLNIPGMAYGGFVGGQEAEPAQMQNPGQARYDRVFNEASMRGPEAVVATHFVLMQRDPEYNLAYNERMNGQ